MSTEALATGQLYTGTAACRNCARIRGEAHRRRLLPGLAERRRRAIRAISSRVEGRLLLDCGPGVLARLRERESWPSVDAVVITHFHLDHWGDLVPWMFGANFGAGRGAEPPELWLPPDGIETLASFGDRFGVNELFDEVFRVREYDDGTAVRGGRARR